NRSARSPAASDEIPVAMGASIRTRALARSTKTILDTDRSAALRKQLIADLARIQSEEEASDWVHKNLPIKNTLTAADADIVEASLREPLAALESRAADSERKQADTEWPSGETTAQHPSTAIEEPFSASTEPPTPPPLDRPARARRRPAAKAIRLR